MERRTFLAIVLSLLVLLVWSSVTAKFSPSIKVSSPQPLQPKSIFSNELAQEIPEAPTHQYVSQKSEILFDESRAAIKEILFKDYQSYRFFLKHAFLLGDKELIFKKDNTAPKNTPTFIYQDQEKQIIKRFVLHPDDYTLELEIELSNLSPQSLRLNLPLILGVLNFSAKPEQARFQDITLASKDRTLHLNGRKETNFPEVRFLSVRDRYFCAIIESGLNGYSGFIKKLNPQESAVGLVVQEAVLAPGQKAGQKFRIYLGPQDLRIIEKANPDWSVVMYHGMFDFLARMLLGALEFFYGFVHNWGLAIVILGLAIYLVLFPLTLKQMRSMKQMQALQPRMEELRKVYKDNPQKLNKEMLELYREHKVNPLGGCLPLILQMPIFIALYQALIRSINLKGAHFLWIQDLSEPDQLFVLPKALPVLGNQINLLPILIAVMMFIQQKISTVSAPSQSKEQQRLMLILFPLMFGFIFYRFPSGLGLYWFINSLLMLLYQFRIRYSR